jgi:hypothetical protein
MNGVVVAIAIGTKSFWASYFGLAEIAAFIVISPLVAISSV